jgi:F-type H+-transporting ATPase subunit delta
MTEQAKHETAFDSDRQYLGDLYAKALIGALEQAATPKDALDQFDSLIEDVWNQQSTMEGVMDSPRVSFVEKERILDRVFNGPMDATLLKFLKVVARHGRMDCLRAIHNSAKRLYDEMCGRKEVVVETAIELDDKLRGKVTEHLKGVLQAEIILHERVDPSLLGGIRVRVGDTVFDGTVANRLRSLQEQVAQQTSRKIREEPQRFSSI